MNNMRSTNQRDRKGFAYLLDKITWKNKFIYLYKIFSVYEMSHHPQILVEDHHHFTGDPIF